jgi:hypothetical protein
MPLPNGIPPKSQVETAKAYWQGMIDGINTVLPNYTSEFDYVGDPATFYAIKNFNLGLSALTCQLMLIDVACYPIAPNSFIFFPFP